VGLAPALLGHLQVVRGSVSGIPYCDTHRERLSLKIGIDKKLAMQNRRPTVMLAALACLIVVACGGSSGSSPRPYLSPLRRPQAVPLSR
jgi:hypothetical protein